jgi:hypothetical protein
MPGPHAPNAGNTRNHGGKKIGYVLRGGRPIPGLNKVNNNIIQLYRRVVFNNASKNWKVDPNYTNVIFYKNRNTGNFNNVKKLYGGVMQYPAEHRWGKIKNVVRQAKRYRRTPYELGPGEPAFNL